MGGVDIHFDHAGVGGDADDVQAGIGWRAVTFDMYRHAQLFRGGLGCTDEFEVVFDLFHGRHKDAQAAITRLYADSGADFALQIADDLFGAVLNRL